MIKILWHNLKGIRNTRPLDFCPLASPIKSPQTEFNLFMHKASPKHSFAFGKRPTEEHMKVSYVRTFYFKLHIFSELEINSLMSL